METPRSGMGSARKTREITFATPRRPAPAEESQAPLVPPAQMPAQFRPIPMQLVASGQPVPTVPTPRSLQRIVSFPVGQPVQTVATPMPMYRPVSGKPPDGTSPDLDLVTVTAEGLDIQHLMGRSLPQGVPIINPP